MDEEKNTLSERRHRFRTGFVAGAFSMLAVCGLIIGAAVYIVRYDGSWILPKIGIRSDTEAADLSAFASKRAFFGSMEQKMQEIDELVEATFIFPVEEQDLMDAALKGYVNGLNDIYSAYYTPEEYEETLSDSDGSYVGIGVVVQQDPKTYVVTALTVYPDSPAEAGGMEKGDIIVKVDGEDVTSWELSDIVSRIRGEEGTPVQVTVYREGDYLDLDMVRAALAKITVEYEMLDNHVGYLLLTEFDQVSVEQIEKAVEALKEEGMERLVLDLRDNPGGLLTSVVSIADDFLPEADVLFVEDKQGRKMTYKSFSGMIFDGPMAVLINGNSASASEVLSGALKDNNRAVLIGEQSFGKGIVQTFFQLSDGSGVKLTTAHYSTPDGTDIHGIGIEPDRVVEDDRNTEEDEQLQAAVEEVTALSGEAAAAEN